MKTHWRLWHIHLCQYIHWNNGRLRCFLRKPPVVMENRMWNGSDLIPVVEAHLCDEDGVMRSRLSLLAASNYRHLVYVEKKRVTRPPSSPSK